MPIRNASAHWEGDIRSGSGTVSLGSGAFTGRYSFNSRFEDGPGTNPEELLGAAHAGCFTMALDYALSSAGKKPTRIDTTAKVHIDSVPGGFALSKIELHCEAAVPDLDDAGFQEAAAGAKAGCPVSKALAGVEITLSAHLVSA